MSNFIYDNVFEGQQLRVSVPMGEFTLDDSADPLVLVSAGIGCTPIMGMLQELVATQSPREVVVLHADQSAAAHAYRHELADLVGRLPAGRLHTWYERAHVEHPADGIGRMSLDRLPIDLSSTVFVCGPRPFMSAINEDLVSLGIPQEQINHELFGPLASAVA
ncbi:oxidoreductase NAD-binding domain protein [Mycobacteroides abscessus MAB_082312_2258]|uniref:Oxidoreductase NAD-binding domain protein n=1 Tax=Mycobacteroides abscessus MAB_091912_2446 TaxID=1335414 RepID=A0A829MIV5_9MYCO|nr:oxidoreductase NAD-binding domain protein [Mycobacteroides abscessus MAB_082312_2258]ESV64336.1 oxidoreductase NAD-binding domain protein [Mycobacteroides abscessus MAB_091912_2446]